MQVRKSGSSTGVERYQNPCAIHKKRVVVPKNILLEKAHGEALTAEEQARIDQAGGLHKSG